MKLAAETLKAQLRETQPVIVLGMHRSGTSLIARLLIDLGIHMGHRLTKHAESLCFQRLNRRIFADADATWSRVDPILQVMHSQEFVNCHADRMQRALFHDCDIAGFFGKQLWNAIRRGESVPWGWKDPRTTITFPIWLRLFPKARLVCVFRNGIDVAISLHRRELKRRRQWWRPFSRRDHASALLEFEQCFRLWEEYISFMLSHKEIVPSNRRFEIHYEHLLAEPHKRLRQLVDFLDYSPVGDDLAAVCEQVDQSRLNNSRYAAGYRDEIPPLASRALMQHLGYDYNVSQVTPK